MIPLQDVDCETKNGKKLRIMLRKMDGGYLVSLQEHVTEGFYAGLYSEFSTPLYKFKTAEEAFKYAVEALILFLTYSDDVITSVNNPCNCELISNVKQDDILKSLDLNITLTVTK